MNNIKKARLKKLFFIFPVIFLIELIFGFSGSMITIENKAIRIILLFLSFISLYAYFLLHLFTNKVKIFSLKKNSYFGDFSLIDWMAVVFEASTILSMTVIPYIMGTSLEYAKNEVLGCAATFSLFFPLSYLVKKREINMQWLFNFMKYAVAIFAAMHMVFYFGQEINVQFVQTLFDVFKDLMHGNCIPPVVILGHGGYSRIIFITSIYLIIGIYFFLRNMPNNKLSDYIILVVEIMAVISTATKSIWYGIFISLIIFLIATIIINRKKNKRYVVSSVVCAVILILVIGISDKLVFHNMFSIRMFNSFITNVSDSDMSWENSDEKTQMIGMLDAEGAVISNQIKIEQIPKLLGKWRKSPIFGFGYGSYVEDYLRSEDPPFSYEMQLFALLMKIGVFGLAIWIAFFVVQFVCMIKHPNKNINKISAWLFLLLAFAICVQTNPFLISFTGFSFIIFLSIISIFETTSESFPKPKRVGKSKRKNISVAMAVYNGEPYIKQQLDSIIPQLGKNDEIIISLDPSNDDSENIIKSYQKADKRIKLIHGEGNGLICNFENTISHCKNSIIFLSDQDDVWYNGKVEEVLACFEDENIMLVMHDASVTDAQMNIISPSFFEVKKSQTGVFKNIVKNCYIGSCMAFKKDLIPYITPFPKHLPMHDQWIGILGEIYGQSVLLDKPLIYYRRHDSNASSSEHASFMQMLLWRVELIAALVIRTFAQELNIRKFKSEK